MELLGALEDRYQVDLSETRFAAMKTVGDLERMLQGKLSVALVITIRHGCSVGLSPGLRTDHLTICFCARQYFCWDGRALPGGKICAAFAGRCWWCAITLTTLTSVSYRPRFPPASGIGWRRPREARRWSRCALRPRDEASCGKLYDRVKWTLGVALLNLFPLPREAGFRESFAFAGESVDRGYSILVFPEGHHTTDGKMRRFAPA